MPLSNEKCFLLSHHSDDMWGEEKPGLEEHMEIEIWERGWEYFLSFLRQKSSSDF